jgi:hypothetical protein
MAIFSLANILFLFVFNTNNFIQLEPPEISEREKIEYLISHVENLKDAFFIRNGRTHSPEDAAKHLRTKLRYSRNHINTAEEFIQICATRSSLTGRKYLITFSDGRSIESGEYLLQLLDELESTDEDLSE